MERARRLAGTLYCPRRFISGVTCQWLLWNSKLPFCVTIDLGLQFWRHLALSHSYPFLVQMPTTSFNAQLMSITSHWAWDCAERLLQPFKPYLACFTGGTREREWAIARRARFSRPYNRRTLPGESVRRQFSSRPLSWVTSLASHLHINSYRPTVRGENGSRCPWSALSRPSPAIHFNSHNYSLNLHHLDWNFHASWGEIM